MPPKFKFTREEIISAALEITRSEGFDAVSARSVAEKLSSSSKPLFSVFENMDELKKATVKAARGVYNSYVERGLREAPAFKGVGKSYIAFAAREPVLFRLLFMSEQSEKRDPLKTLPMIDDNYEKILSSVEDCYNLGMEKSQRLYRHLWLYTHGIATLIATGVCSFTNDEISEMLTEVCISLLKKIKEQA